MLTIAEKLLLLSLHDRKGTILYSASGALSYGLSGGLLVELTLMNRLALHNKKVMVNDANPVDDPLLNQVLQEIKDDPKSRTAKYWVNHLDRKLKGIRNKVSTQLVKKGIVDKQTIKVLWIFPKVIYPLIDLDVKYTIKEELRHDIIQTNEPGEYTAVLGSMVYACNLLNDVFPVEEKRIAKKRLKQLSKNEVYGKAVSEAVQAMQAAVITAATVAAVSASSSSSSS